MCVCMCERVYVVIGGEGGMSVTECALNCNKLNNSCKKLTILQQQVLQQHVLR